MSCRGDRYFSIFNSQFAKLTHYLFFFVLKNTDSKLISYFHTPDNCPFPAGFFI